MAVDRELLIEAQTRLELRENELLSWGIVDAAFTEGELEAILTEVASDVASVQGLKEELLDRVLIARVPSGGYRTRMAETLRTLSRLRQSFPTQQWWEGTPLVLDYRFVHRPRRRPRRDRPRNELITHLAQRVSANGRLAAERCVPTHISGFQFRSAEAVLDAYSRTHDTAVMVTAGTGAGKTMAFYLPAMSLVAESVGENSAACVRLLALYPRGELLKDQLRAAIQLSMRIGQVQDRPIRVGTWFGATPRAAFWLREGWVKDWKLRRDRGVDLGWDCPFLTCPMCNSTLIWNYSDVEASREQLHCISENCGQVIGSEFITLTRERAASDPPDLMFTTTESLNRQLAAPDQHRAFGLRGKRARMVLLDEVHTYEGTSGAQNALLLRRLRKTIAAPVVWAGLSATLEDAPRFLAGLTGVFDDRVLHVEPLPDELEETGAEYMVALRHDPSSLTSPLSTTIQTAMAITRALDARGTPYNPAPSSEGIFGRKTFVFTDKLDVTNRLYWDLLDAEGWWQPGRPKNRRVLTLAHLRAEEQLRRKPDEQEAATDRDSPGQWWWLAEALGRDLGGDEQLVVDRTYSSDSGVNQDAEVIVTTASLEVGYDDPDVGAVIQHKSPHDLARFVQRKGRAGRDPSMRPWTAVVLADWGRDRVTWQLYDQLFDPVLSPRYLPIKNRHVLRMQTVYATLDWAGGRLDAEGRDRSLWSDLAGPASVLETSDQRIRARRDRQEKLGYLLQEVLDGGPARDHLRAHLRRALGLGDGDRGRAELDELLWGSPRPLMLAVLPTALRRLRSNWSGEVPTRQDHSVRTRTPMREFVAGNLFDDLMVPEVEIRVPSDINSDADDYGTETLPVLRTIRELMPGNVTRHFGVSSWSRRHWVPLSTQESGEITLNVVDAYRAHYVTSLPASPKSPSPIDLYRPMEVTLSVPPEHVRDSSSVLPVWRCIIDSLGSGREIAINSKQWQPVLSSVCFHTHALGDGARVHRMALGAHGSTVVAGGAEPEPVVITFESSSRNENRVGLGVEIEVDAVQLQVQVTSSGALPLPVERSDRLRSLIMGDEALPVNLNWFQRLALASALVVVLVEECNREPAAKILDELADSSLSDALIDALERIGLLAAGDPHALDAGQTGDAGGESHNEGSRRHRMIAWCRHETVLQSIREAADNALGPRDQEWEQWRRRRIAATVAATVVEAGSRVCPDISAEELVIDLGETDELTGLVEVWITELAPGGNGQVEELLRAMAHDPQQFGRVLERCLEPSEIESLDGELREFLALVVQNNELMNACRRLQESWVAGHTEVSRAFVALRSAAEERGFKPHRAAWTTVVNRLLRPGSRPELLSTAQDLLQRWDDLKSRLGLEIDVRAFGALCADEDTLDLAFHLPPGADGILRSRTVSNFFWPRSGSATSLGSDKSDPFGVLPELDRSGLRELLGNDPKTLFLDTWNDTERHRVHDSLRESGDVRLSFLPKDNRLARDVILDLQDVPTDIGVLFSYPSIVGIERTHNMSTVVTISMAEVP
ncbi:MAG: DEAD/DEAH box helicase [Acidimicrobiia bacterium]|nr:DEAD/DEAH box helicase [Acidimicrobiia bacterium]MCY4458156.1 protein DpdJ [Acidimicrobiaceae bacterium]